MYLKLLQSTLLNLTVFCAISYGFECLHDKRPDPKILGPVPIVRDVDALIAPVNT